MTEADLQIIRIYLDAFTNPLDWNPDDHLAGLKAVFAAGAAAQRKKDAA